MFRLRVLGGFGLEGPSGMSITLAKRRAEAVLAVLSVCGDLACTRDRLIALFWPESDEAHSRHALRDALHVIRQALGPDAVHAAGDRLRLDPTVVDSDVLAFSQALTDGRHAEAVRAYGGSFLDGFHVDGSAEFERWVDGERTLLARQYVEALEHLATAAESRGTWGEAASWWARAVEHDPVNSHLVLRQMRALAAKGDGANAIKVADRYANRLREELDLNPDREVRAEVKRIRRGAVPHDDGTHRDVPIAAEPRGNSALPSPAPAESASAGAGSASTRVSRRMLWVAGATVVVLLAAAAVWQRMRFRADRPRYPRTSIAVLPFRNLTADTAHAYLASGLHDELLTQLAKVATLRVIWRTSLGAYEGTSKPLRQIGEELAVGSIVEGSVQVVQNRLRVDVQLVDPVTEAVLWADRYDRTLDDAFAVESDIAQRIVATAGATLTSAEVAALGAVPTQNAEAYQLYLQGLDYWRRPRGNGPRGEIAQQLFERALALDSTFAPAHAALSLVHGETYQDFGDRSPARLALQQHEAEEALRLAPDLPQAHLAMGVLYKVRYEVARALAEFGIALRGAPNDVDAWEWAGFAHRQLGNWDSALVAFDHVIRLDPRDVKVIVDRGYTLEYLRRYGAAVDAFRHALELAPDYVRAHIEIGYLYMKWKGDWDTLNAVVAALPGETWRDDILGVNLLQRRADRVLALLRAFPGPAGLSGLGSNPRMLIAGDAHRLRGDWAAARAAYDSAATALDSVERARPDDWLVHGMRGEALAGLGRRADALREARWLEQSDAYRKDQCEGTWPAASRSIILAGVGETDAAIAELERLLARPSQLSVPELRLNVGWDPIRNDPRFQALLVKYAHPAEQ